ncbi:Bgt-2917 [Blumeria graminis f. sp. tritici]|uniref:Bgt-2917 n=2 Tax=Blumeria graminis f. sp. tritici TaxID=62690 RepID=A0A9X9MHQ5_BLUGR|nr:Bgt-2917 [Blumeria graminis f. sp. tritici]
MPANNTFGPPKLNAEKKVTAQSPELLNVEGDGDTSFEDSEGSDVEEEEYDEDEDVTPIMPKRKRASIKYAQEASLGLMPSPEGSTPKRLKPSVKVRGVVVGVWRDSCESDDAEKHAVFGFIDLHDRLRTRIYAMNRRGEELIGNAPMGVGGCWVTFDRILFDQHLQGLSPSELKEYVKIRQAGRPEIDYESRKQADLSAVEKARSIVAQQESTTPITRSPSARATGALTRNSLGRQSLSRLSTSQKSGTGFNTTNDEAVPKTKALQTGETKSQGIILGFWSDSDGVRDEDKHAVFGVLGGSDSFRVKVARQTRDGRPRDGNYPLGAGALWLNYEKLVLEPHLRTCSRPEVKEYCRIRQEQLRFKETEKERKSNELNAVTRAKQIIASKTTKDSNSIQQRRVSSDSEPQESSTKSEQKNTRQQTDTVEQAEVTNRPKRGIQVAREAPVSEKPRRESIFSEASVTEAAEKELRSNMKKLNKVWVAQQAATSPEEPTVRSVESEVRYHNGIKYERKKNGPFQGKLVSPAQILSIDGEDFVEYRILTKPSFD